MTRNQTQLKDILGEIYAYLKTETLEEQYLPAIEKYIISLQQVIKNREHIKSLDTLQKKTYE